MINIPPIKQSTAVKTDLITNVTRTWKVGQILNGSTQRGGDAQSNVLIRVGQQTIEAKTPVTLQNGQDVKLLIKSLGEFQNGNLGSNQISKLPVLSILDTQTAISENNKIAAVKLRQFIAIQQTFSQVQQLADKLLSSRSITDQLPASLKNSLSNLQQTLQVNTKNINPAQLKQQILNSGVFLESKLLQQTSGSSLVNDFKYQLLTIKSELAKLIPAKEGVTQQTTSTLPLEQLQTSIKKLGDSFNNSQLTSLADKLISLLPKTSIIQLNNMLAGIKPDVSVSNELQSLTKLLTVTLQQHGNHQSQQLQEQLHFRLMLLDLNQQVEQSISKITSLQLQPMSREGDNLVLLLFNLVFKDSHERFDIDFRIQQENEETDPEEQSWSVTLSFNFKTLGKVQSNIHLTGNQVSSVFHTEYVTTADKIKQFLPLLETGLVNTGLNIVKLSVENNLIESKPFVSNQVNLLDEKA
ncbi:MAG: hypothetical protein DIZ80_05040 [endosymbiont of Galathealinum brachiosum]|uniref:Flagellar hook-length control protein-like C-terminal domain-containing protein n=1 Tax=endosymbiont of Galathealinum brachiosum TaxID=2200906 RepID=A0A370DIX5_9GAMM|nr:MAG: hypothetical protein DIZ80_05040 [endosymbiont of Galathealinum brachiosum]